MAARFQRPTGAELVAVVDDDEDVRDALDGMLNSLGYRSTLWDNADSFLAADMFNNVDCIISDVHMPGTSGLALAERMKTCSTPVILITAFPTAAVQLRAKAAGVRCLLTKPFDSEELIDQLRCTFS